MLIGNVGNMPTLKHTPSGVPVTSFRMATSSSRKDKDGNLIEITDWHSVVAWRHLAQIITKIVNKGSRVYVEGRLQTREIDDGNGGRKEFVEIVADQFLILDSKEKRRQYDAENGEEGEDYDYNYDDNSYSDDYDSEYGDGYAPNEGKNSPF
jgi:single-strand DNA-binding protein